MRTRFADLLSAWVLGVVASAGCGDAKTCDVPEPVIDTSAFEIVPAEDDPFEADAGPADGGTEERGRCLEDATLVEQLGDATTYSIVTIDCSRLTVEAPTLLSLEANEELELRFWHFSLLPFGPAEGHLALEIDGQTEWTGTVPIPSESELIVDSITVPRALPEGTAVRWHVSNHGANSWNFVALNATRPGKCSAIE